MQVGVEIDPVPEGLNDRDDAGRKRAPGHNLEISGQGPKGQAAEISQEPAFELEEDPQHLGDGEDDLAMRDIQNKCLPHPLAPRLNALSVAGGAEPPGAAGENDEPLRTTVRTSDAGSASQSS